MSRFQIFCYSISASFFAAAIAGFLYLNNKVEKNTVHAVSVDFEQGYYDARSANIKNDPGQWMSERVEEYCKDKKCLIVKGNTVLGGEVFDVNQLYRKAFGIRNVAKKPAENAEELLEIIQGITTPPRALGARNE